MALTVNGAAIEEAAVVAEMDRLRPEYTAYVQENGGQPSEAQLREWAEEDLVEAAVFRQAAVSTQPVPSDERVARFLEENAEAYRELDPAARAVKAREALQQRRLIKEIRKGVAQPGEGEVRAYYDAHPELFVVPETLRVSHVCRFVSPGNKAEAFLELLRVKADLDHFKLSWIEALESCSDSYRQDQGLFSPVSRETAPPELAEKLFALKPGQVSDVVEMPGGESLHLFRLLAVDPARTLANDEVSEHLRGVLFEEACQEALHATFDELKEAAVIQRGA
jgi:parvulin-like peptidyl-prolyl isomerase